MSVSQSFYHTLLLNSEFCESHFNHNLRFINWIRPRGCSCKLLGEGMCGCSPIDIGFDHKEKLLVSCVMPQLCNAYVFKFSVL